MIGYYDIIWCAIQALCQLCVQFLILPTSRPLTPAALNQLARSMSSKSKRSRTCGSMWQWMHQTGHARNTHFTKHHAQHILFVQLHHLDDNAYTQSLKSPHSLRGTIISMGRRGGMKSTKSPLNIPKTSGTRIQIQTHILIELGLNIMEGRNIKTSIACQKNDLIWSDSSQIPVGRSMHVSNTLMQYTQNFQKELSLLSHFSFLHSRVNDKCFRWTRTTPTRLLTAPLPVRMTATPQSFICFFGNLKWFQWVKLENCMREMRVYKFKHQAAHPVHLPACPASLPLASMAFNSVSKSPSHSASEIESRR